MHLVLILRDLLLIKFFLVLLLGTELQNFENIMWNGQCMFMCMTLKVLAVGIILWLSASSSNILLHGAYIHLEYTQTCVVNLLNT